MTASEFRAILATAPLIASVQTAPGSPVDHPETITQLAQASLSVGAKILRLQGVANIRAVRASTDAVIIGLIKRDYDDSKVYITPTEREVRELLEAGCDVIALDATLRYRPGDGRLKQLIAQAHAGGALVMADCDTLASAMTADLQGADLISTTLAGYTEETSNMGAGPAINLVREIAERTTKPVLAEGRYAETWHAWAARRAGASGVVIGGALNDPLKQTTAFLAAAANPTEDVLAVDIGGTWIRAAKFTSSWEMLTLEREPLPATRQARQDWIRAQADKSGVRRIAISTGGTIDPASLRVIESKPLIPDHLGTDFRQGLDGYQVAALNDGLATAWGHSCHAQFAGKRVATLALGTGVGCGFVAGGRIWMGPRGEYIRLNDLPAGASSFEDLLGGAALSPTPNAEQMEAANEAVRQATGVIRAILLPDEIVLAGGVGHAPWLKSDLPRSPFGEHAGLYGAAALALFPTWR